MAFDVIEPRWYSIAQVAKQIIPAMGRNKLYLFLRERLVTDENDVPMDAYANCGYFITSIKSVAYRKKVVRSLKVSAEGVRFIQSLLNSQTSLNSQISSCGGISVTP